MLRGLRCRSVRARCARYLQRPWWQKRLPGVVKVGVQSHDPANDAPQYLAEGEAASAGWRADSTPVLKLRLPPPPKLALAPALVWQVLHPTLRNLVRPCVDVLPGGGHSVSVTTETGMAP